MICFHCTLSPCSILSLSIFFASISFFLMGVAFSNHLRVWYSCRGGCNLQPLKLMKMEEKKKMINKKRKIYSATAVALKLNVHIFQCTYPTQNQLFFFHFRFHFVFFCVSLVPIVNKQACMHINHFKCNWKKIRTPKIRHRYK